MPRGFWEQLRKEADLEDEPVPGQPIVELAGDRRIYIEGHSGVWEYSRKEICVSMKYGILQICGHGLELSCMTRDSLMIRGQIDCVALKRRINR